MALLGQPIADSCFSSFICGKISHVKETDRSAYGSDEMETSTDKTSVMTCASQLSHSTPISRELRRHGFFVTTAHVGYLTTIAGPEVLKIRLPQETVQ